MKRVLITGGCGFVGSNLAVKFIEQGYAVTVLDNLSRHGSAILLKRVLARGATFIQADVRDAGALEKLKEAYALTVLCSAEPSILVGAQGHEARYLLDVNLQGSINCFEWARERRVPVIFISTSRVYPYDRLNACQYHESSTRFEFTGGCAGVTDRGISVDMPLTGVRSLYGASKLAAELVLQEYAVQYGLPALINRCGVIAGPWQLGKAEQGVFAFWVAQHYYQKPLNYIGFGGMGKQVRDLLHVDDLAELVFKQARCLVDEKRFYRGEVFNAGGSVAASLSLHEATEICARLTGNNVNVGRIIETRPADLAWYVTDNGRTEDAFDWKPCRSAVKVLEDIYQWIRDNEDDCRKIFGISGT